MTQFLFPDEEIAAYSRAEKTPREYADFVAVIFREFLGRGSGDPVWKLLSYLDKTDYYTAPASSRYHGASRGGLVRHSLSVTSNAVRLAPVMLAGDVDLYYLAVSCLFHDLCKLGMYEESVRNVKNEATGSWEKKPFFRVREDYSSYGHGIESMLKIHQFIALPESWSHAVRWHMGAYDISPLDKFELDKAVAKYREVLLLQTADMLSGVVDDV